VYVERENSIVARIRKSQREDIHLRQIIELAETKTADGFVIRAGLLFKICDDGERLVVPRLMHSQMVHDRGHFLASKTEQIIKKDYWIPNLRAKVERIVALRVVYPCGEEAWQAGGIVASYREERGSLGYLPSGLLGTASF